MTVSTSVNEVNVTVATAIGSTANIPFLYLAETDIVVIDNGTLKALNTDYTLSAAGVDTGGTLTTVTAFSNAALGTRIIRSVAKTQLTDYQETGPFSAESHEDALDRLTMISQAALSRDTTTAETWDAQSDKIVNVTDPTAAQDAVTKNYADDIVAAAGNVVAPVNDDLGFHYEATGVGTHAWRVSDEVPTPTSGQVTDKAKTVLRPDTVTKGSTSAFDLSNEVPTPTATNVTRNERTVLVPVDGTVTDGAYTKWLEITTPSENWMYNSDFSVAQKGVTFNAATAPLNNNDTWLIDRWLLLSDGNDRCDVLQRTAIADTPNGAFGAIRLEGETLSSPSQKFGIAQILEARDTRRLLRDGTSGTGTVVSLSFEAHTESGLIRNLRAGVLAWDSTSDSVTSDLVSAWGAEGTNPTPVANWTFENTPANLVLTNSFTRFTINDITLNTTTTVNLAVFIWVDDTDIANGGSDRVFISKVKLERGDIDTPYQATTFADELARCQRYWCQSHDQGVAPGTSTEVGSVVANSTVVNAANSCTIDVRFPVTMRILPHTTEVRSTTGAIGNIRDTVGTTDRAATIRDVGSSGFHISNTTTTIVADRVHQAHFTADAEL